VRVQGVLDQRPRPDSDQEALRIHLAHIGDLAVLKPPPPDYAPVLGWIAVAVSLLVVLTLSWALTLRRSVRLRTAELEQATAAKSQFLANMSHEIRTPMHAMLGLVQVLGRQPLSAAQAELVRNVAQAGKSLLRILNDILDYSRVEAGQLVLERQAFTLPEFLAHLDTLFRESAHGRGLRWEVHPPAGAPVEGPLLGDPVRVQQILANLASNAIKFTEHGGVELTTQILLADADHVRVRFTVTDTGPGIPPQTLARLFQPFTQADASIHRRYGGTGLGLSICRRLTELMGGTLGADSQPGQGSTFWVELPFPRAQAPAEAAAAAAAKPQAGRRPLAGRRVMVVDDNPLNRRLAEWVLTEEGATALLVDSAVAALAQLGTGPAPVDAVLMDLQMPELDGLEATRRLRQQPGHATLPILACTADTSPQTRATALAAGATDFLPKPVDVDDLVAALVRCLPASPEPAAPAPEPMAPTAAPDLASLPSVPGLDTGHAARALRGDARLHRRMVREFVAQFGDLAGQMRGDLAAGRRPAAARRLHQLLGITGYVGALDLANTARQLQETLRTDNADATSLLDAFADELESLLQTLREHLAISAENEGAPTPATRAEPVVQR
jgi:signal transduction histidine kinase/ActR/RegA family two-component response regulator